MLTSHLALITGATSGIGRALALELAQKRYELILTGRRQQRLDEVAREASAISGSPVHLWNFDVADFKAAETLVKAHESLVGRMTVLINNAGLAKGTASLDQGAWSDWNEMIDTNVKGVLAMTRLIVPVMRRRGSGHIVNIGSVAGRWVYPGGGVYCATKHAVRALSEGLRMDLHGTGIRVTNIEPGMVETEFSLVRFQNPEKAEKVYEHMKPLTSEDIAQTVSWCLERPPHVNIQELVIFPTDQASISMVHRKA